MIKSLRGQIQLLVFGSVILTSAAILAAFWINTSQFIRDQVDRSFAAATDTFRQLLESREFRLISSAVVLTSDFGFKQAVATRDIATIRSALINHSKRVDAELMFLTDLGGRLQAATDAAFAAQPRFEDEELLQEAGRTGGAFAFMEVGGRLFQLAVVPVRAPIPVAFAGLGYQFDEEIARELKALTNLEVTFRPSSAPDNTVTTLEPEQLPRALAASSRISPYFGLPLAPRSGFASDFVDLRGAGGRIGSLVLTTNLAPYYEEFGRLRDEILVIAAILLVLSALASATLADNISGPLQTLSRVASRIARGDYRQETPEPSELREIDRLSSAIDQMSTDIDEREQRITHQAQHDSLTDLLNRDTLTDTLSGLLTNSGGACLIISFNVSGFKSVNDAFGPAIGDKCLQAIAGRLQYAVQAGGLGARFSGDEFVVALPVAPEASATDKAHRLLAHLSEPVRARDITLNLRFRAGYALYPEHGDSAADLLRRSSIALDRARRGGETLRAYAKGEDEEHIRSLTLLHDLEAVLEHNDGQLFMCYQPKKNLRTGSIDELEALIRWIHPEQGMVPADLFISLAEQSSLMASLTDWVIAEVIRQRAQWHSELPDLQVAINIASQDLDRADLLPKSSELLSRAGLPHHAICFEMTERDMMSDAEHALSVMSRIRDAGFDLSVDDYGIGQSSLSRLKQMPVSKIKIDKHFILNLDQSQEDQTIVRSTIELGHSFGLRVIAEGVENQASEQLLAEFGCDYIQGYHLARPMPAGDVSPWILDRVRADLSGAS